MLSISQNFLYRAGAGLILAALLLGVGSRMPVAAAGLGQAAEPTPVVTAEPGAASDLVAEGRLAPAYYASLSAAESGQAEAVFVSEGQQVQAGTVLLRLAHQQQLVADLATAEYELLAAQQALEALSEDVSLQLAQQQRELAVEQKALAFARNEVASRQAPAPAYQLEQTHANLVLAEKRLERIQKDIRIWENRMANKKSLYWWFLDKGNFVDILDNLDRARIMAQRRYEDLLERYADLQAPKDALDIAQAEAKVGVIQARIDEIQRKIAELQAGPDPDAVALAAARVRAAEAALAAARSVQQNAEVVASISGKVAEVSAKAGEWVEAGNPAVVLVGDSGWVVETDDLTELQVSEIQPGQAVTVQVDALPELALSGVVEAIKPLYEEKRGDVTYTVRIALDQTDPRLRWGMTVTATFEQAAP